MSVRRFSHDLKSDKNILSAKVINPSPISPIIDADEVQKRHLIHQIIIYDPPILDVIEA